MTPDEAAAIGQDALIWLAGQPETLASFLAASGLAPEDLRRRAADPEFLGFVLEFIGSSDQMIIDFTAEAGLAPAAPMLARAALPGGADRNWT